MMVHLVQQPEALPTHARSPHEYPTTCGTPALYVAVVVDLDRVRFTASASSRAQLFEHVARYVGLQADHTLWPADARDVRVLLGDGRFEAAVERYFACVGGRWDKEWLSVTGVDVAGAGDVLGAA